MRKFGLKLLTFSLPFAVILGWPALVMFGSGEHTGVAEVIALQSEATRPVLFGRAYSDPTARYKLQSVLHRRPEVLILGTSRVLAIRAAFFRSDVNVFNAGNGVTRLGHLQQFLERLPAGSTPGIIVLGLDQYSLNPNFESLATDDIVEQWSTERSAVEIFFASWKTIYRDYFERKFTLAQVRAPAPERRIGLNARVHANAFRNDGSYHWGQLVNNPLNPENPDYRFRNTLDRIAKGDRRFQYSERVGDENIAELRRFLSECHDRGIHVIGFLPPFAHVVYERMQAMPVQYGYLREIPERVEPLFAEFGYRFFDFSDLATLGSRDGETIDGFHGSEKAYLRLFIRMAQDDNILGKLSRDPEYLLERLQQAQGDHQVFEMHE